MFKAEESSKDSFLQQTKAAREERAHEKCKEDAIVCIQKHVRGWIARSKIAKKILQVSFHYLFFYQFFLSFLLSDYLRIHSSTSLALYQLFFFFFFFHLFRDEFDLNFPDESHGKGTCELKLALNVYRIVTKFLRVFRKDRDQTRIENLCR